MCVEGGDWEIFRYKERQKSQKQAGGGVGWGGCRVPPQGGSLSSLNRFERVFHQPHVFSCTCLYRNNIALFVLAPDSLVPLQSPPKGKTI